MWPVCGPPPTVVRFDHFVPKDDGSAVAAGCRPEAIGLGRAALSGAVLDTPLGRDRVREGRSITMPPMSITVASARTDASSAEAPNGTVSDGIRSGGSRIWLLMTLVSGLVGLTLRLGIVATRDPVSYTHLTLPTTPYV